MNKHIFMQLENKIVEEGNIYYVCFLNEEISLRVGNSYDEKAFTYSQYISEHKNAFLFKAKYDNGCFSLFDKKDIDLFKPEKMFKSFDEQLKACIENDILVEKNYLTCMLGASLVSKEAFDKITTLSRNNLKEVIISYMNRVVRCNNKQTNENDWDAKNFFNEFVTTSKYGNPFNLSYEKTLYSIMSVINNRFSEVMINIEKEKFDFKLNEKEFKKNFFEHIIKLMDIENELKQMMFWNKVSSGYAPFDKPLILNDDELLYIENKNRLDSVLFGIKNNLEKNVERKLNIN